MFRNVQKSVFAAGIAAAAAGLAYLLQSWQALFLLRSSLDEGNYLLKGYLFASGAYVPYQPYGPWVNKMPLAFLIQGWVQQLFEPGLRTGRYFAFALGALLLLGLWLTVRRTSGMWWAAAALWALALNPVGIKTYSQAISQVLVACVLVWVCAFTLGKERKNAELVLGAALAGGLILIRENMLPVLPFILLYILWQHGWRKALLAAVAGLAALIIGHVVFWPDILRNWAKWLPASLTPFLDAWRVPSAGVRTYIQDLTLLTQIMAVFEGVRFNFIAYSAVLAGWWLWPQRKLWRSQDAFRQAVVLSSLFVLLTAAHLWASVGGDYCVYCFSGYAAFFSPMGILLAAIILSNVSWSLPARGNRLSRVFGGLLAAGMLTLVVAGSIFDAYNWLWGTPLYESLEPWLYELRIPRPGGAPVEIWRLFVNKFGLNGDLARVEVLPYMASAMLGLLVAALLLLFAMFIKRMPYARRVMVTLIAAGFVLSPTPMLGGARYTYECDVDMLAAFEQVGADLAARIPPGSVVDWRGGGRASPALLLYLQNVKIFPPQLNGDYSFRTGGDKDELFRYGYWNEELSRQWMEQADYLLVPSPSSEKIEEQIRVAGYKELTPPPPLGYCPQKFELRLFGKH